MDQPLGTWMAVLDRIEEAVRQSLAQAQEPPAPPPVPSGPDPMQRLGERLAAWERSLARIEEEATAASRDFNAEEEALVEWKASLAKLRHEAAEWAARAA
ncbi:MAG: hypothetical protein K2W96_01400 [Gemmataceae bacterium]|nr:hypothetical protein [Gemmataceae bacterium]